NQNKRHIVGLKYNLTLGNVVANLGEDYKANLYYNTVPLELTYTYLIDGKRSFNIGLIGGKYNTNDFTGRDWDAGFHSMKYVGIKPGFGLQTSRTLGRSIIHYN